MRSSPFDRTNLELKSDPTFALKNPQIPRVHLGGGGGGGILGNLFDG